MSDNMEQSQAQLQFIVPHPYELKIALIPKDKTWTLPTIIPDLAVGRYYQHYLAGMTTRRIWDWNVVTLYQAQALLRTDFQQNRWVYVVENLDQQTELPNNGRWVTKDEVAQLTLDDADLLPIIERYFDEKIHNSFPAERAAWAYDGWQASAFEWIRQQIQQLGHTITGEVELIRVWCITATYRIPTDVGYFYFKAVPPVFEREIPATRWLQELFPQHLPRIAGYDSEQNFLLMHDFDAPILKTMNEVSAWELGMRTYAQIQLATVNHIDTMLDLGAMDYHLDTLLSKYESLLADEDFVKPSYFLKSEDIIAIRKTVPAIEQAISDLKALALPNTILHCDFQALNVAIKDDTAIIFDWTDMSIGCPIIDLASMEHFIRQSFPDDAETLSKLRDAYLSEFSNHLSLEQLQNVYPSAEILGSVLQAVNYHHLLRSIEPSERWVLDTIPQFLKNIVRLTNNK